MQTDRRVVFLRQLAELEERFNKQRPELELTVRDGGLEGYVVVWNSAPGRNGPLGPCGKGGTRISLTTSLEEVATLAKTMALKNAAAGLPLGGAKSGIKADPQAPGFERLYRRFVDLIKPILRENGGIFGGLGFDIGAQPVHAIWACDQLGSYKSFTGKPVEMGGTDYDREGIAGLGVAVAAKTLLEQRGKQVSQTSFAVQGVGAMGAAVVRYLSEMGGRIAFIADPRIGGCVELPDTMPPDVLKAIVQQDVEATKALCANLRHYPSDEVLYRDVDVLIPAAIQHVIREDNCGRIKARYICEAANNPTVPKAQKKLQERGIIILPDFIANSGGIIAAYVELLSQISVEENARTRQNVEDAKRLTREKIADTVRQVIQLSEENQVDLISAARMKALQVIVG